MQAGIIGSGPVGQTLATGLLKIGYTVTIGSRDPAKLADFAAKSGAKAGSFAEAATADIVFLCTSWSGTQSALNLAGAENLKGKVVVDVTNPLDFSAGPPPKLAVVYPNSAGALVQSWLPGAKVVKAFNIVTAKYMIDARLEEGVADLFIAGNDESAKAKVAEIAKAWHWGSVNDLGAIAQAYWIECYAMFWIQFGFKNNHWTHAFKLMKK